MIGSISWVLKLQVQSQNSIEVRFLTAWPLKGEEARPRHVGFARVRPSPFVQEKVR